MHCLRKPEGILQEEIVYRRKSSIQSLEVRPIADPKYPEKKVMNKNWAVREKQIWVVQEDVSALLVR